MMPELLKLKCSHTIKYHPRSQLLNINFFFFFTCLGLLSSKTPGTTSISTFSHLSGQPQYLESLRLLCKSTTAFEFYQHHVYLDNNPYLKNNPDKCPITGISQISSLNFAISPTLKHSHFSQSIVTKYYRCIKVEKCKTLQ